MAIDDTSVTEGYTTNPSEGSGHGPKFIAIFLVLAALAIGEIYTLSQLSSIHSSVQNEQARVQKDIGVQLEDQISSRLSAIQRSNAQQFEALKKVVGTGTKRVGSGGDSKRTRELVAKLEKEQTDQAEMLKQQIATKADQQQVGALTQDVSATRTDLDSAKKSLDSLRSDIGMARSELGNLIARNHDELDTLRKLGERDYFEFTLDRKHPQQIAGVGLVLKKTNVKQHRFNLALQADDMVIEKKDRTINEPVIFYVHGAKKPYELVINKVLSDRILGYLSAPKGATEVAATQTGGSR